MKNRRSSIRSIIIILCMMTNQAIPQEGGKDMGIVLSSPSFRKYVDIPGKYTCEGDDISPPLEWSGVPEQARSLVLIMEDPDAPDPKAPKMVWVHWILYNLPPTLTGLPEHVTPSTLPPGTREGLNDWKKNGYGGPCPPTGRHRYFFKLYALDTLLPDLHRPTKTRLLDAMEGHILREGEHIGRYEKKSWSDLLKNFPANTK